MDERESQTDGDGGKPGRRPLVGGAEDDHEEHECQDHLGGQARQERVAARRMGAKGFDFADFAASMRFVHRAADLAEARNHHPEILIEFNRVTLSLHSHDVNAITKRGEDGIVVVDPNTCIGCGFCVWACPFNAPQLTAASGKMEKCNFCQSPGLERPVGALVNDVNAGSAAERAGIQPGDVILAFNDEAIESSGDLPPLVGANPPGTKAEVLVSRNGEEKTFVVTLDALESDEDGNLLTSSSESGQSNALGIVVEQINENRRRALGGPEGGVIVSRIESDAAFRAGLRTGDVILAINNESVEDAEAFDQIAQSLPQGKAVALRVMREGVTRYLAYSPAVED